MSDVETFCKNIIENLKGKNDEDSLKYILDIINKECVSNPERAIKISDSDSDSDSGKYKILDIISTNCYCRLNSKGFPTQCKSVKFNDEKMCKRHTKMYKDTGIIHGEGMMDEIMPMHHLPGSKKVGKNHCWKCDSDGNLIVKETKKTIQTDPTVKRKQKKCGNCGEYGHMKKTCKVDMNITKIPLKKAKVAVVEPVSVEPVSVEPVSVEPVSVEQVSVEPVSVEPSDGHPFPVQEDDKDIELKEALQAITPSSVVIDESDGVNYPKVKFNTNINEYKTNESDEDDLGVDDENYGFTQDGVKYVFENTEEGEKQVINDEYEPVGIWNGELGRIEWDCEDFEEAHKNHEDYIAS